MEGWSIKCILRHYGMNISAHLCRLYLFPPARADPVFPPTCLAAMPLLGTWWPHLGETMEVHFLEVRLYDGWDANWMAKIGQSCGGGASTQWQPAFWNLKNDKLYNFGDNSNCNMQYFSLSPMAKIILFVLKSYLRRISKRNKQRMENLSLRPILLCGVTFWALGFALSIWLRDILCL